jgi:hypothetical protein
LATSLTGQEAKEAQSELQVIRSQADKIRKLDRILGQLGDDDDLPELTPEPVEDDILEKEIVIPHIDTSGPNPFDLDAASLARLKEIDAKLGITEADEAGPVRSIGEINEDLIKLYQPRDEEEGGQAKAPEVKASEPVKPVGGVKALNRKK